MFQAQQSLAGGRIQLRGQFAAGSTACTRVNPESSNALVREASHTSVSARGNC